MFSPVRVESRVQRKDESRRGWMSSAHLSILFSITVPYLYSSKLWRTIHKTHSGWTRGRGNNSLMRWSSKWNWKVGRRNVCTFLCWSGKHWPESKSLTKSEGKVLEEILSQNYSYFVEACGGGGGICEVCLNAGCNQIVSEKPHWMSLSETPCRNYSHSLITLMSWAAFLSSINFSPWEQSEKSNSGDLKWVLSLKKTQSSWILSSGES